MKQLADLLRVRPGEGRRVALIIGVMLFTAAGSTIGGTGIEALFFSRFGVQYLPYMYMVLGAVGFLTSLAITAMLGRLPREVLYVTVPLALAFLLIGERLLTSFNWAYPVMWLGKEVMDSLIGLSSWGLAGALCDTRQAKRLFPLFNAGRIFGAVIGGLGTGLVVGLLGTENLLLVWAAAMFVAFVLGRVLVGWGATNVPARKSSRRRPSLFTEMQRGYQFVRRSPLMQWASAAAVLFSVLFFSLALPFSKAATSQFTNEDSLAGFLGLFQGLSTAAAFLTSLFVANRLFTRFGIMKMILALPVIYVIGFGLLAAYDRFPVLVVFRFAQVLWLSGVADSAYQAMFNAVPSERRDQVRAFIGGVPAQAGTFIAGLVLVIGEQALASQQLYLIGLGAAVATTFVIWQAARAYGGALVAALRAGQPQLFFSQEEPFGGFRHDAAAVSVAVQSISDPDPAIRRISAEILGNLSVPRATGALVSALADPEAQVRAAALKALARANATPALLDVSACLKDSEPEVRLQAVEAVRQLAGYPQGIAAYISPLLADPESAVRARAAVALLRVGSHPDATDMLRSMAALGEVDDRVHALTALGEWGDAEAFELIAIELGDAHAPPRVRRAAASALASCGADTDRVVASLVEALTADDRSVRESVASALGRVGAPALDSTITALFNSESESGALLALEHLPLHRATDSIRRYARERAASALHYHALWSELEPRADDDRMHLLADSLRDKARRHGVNVLRAINLLDGRDSMPVVIDNLNSRDPNQRANALETLESGREAQLVRPLLKLWESAETASPVARNGWSETLIELMRESDAWLRACAALAASVLKEPKVLEALTQLAESDTDPVVRDAARRTVAILNGGPAVDTLPTLSLMERILFLRRVPLFADLSPADLKQVAAIANEHYFTDGEVIAYQGEAGNEMFIIVSGEVRVLVAADGKPETEVARRKPGEYVGEVSIISQEPRMASLVAAGDVRTLCIDRKNFEGLLRERPETSLAVMRVLCVRLREMTR
ncbi:MAG TPA: HEAT repeat domain-containing protein [Anaerolineales bacterium]|nr:HEAT repeat domain-containing protein [Anaerolineales bacterium]